MALIVGGTTVTGTQTLQASTLTGTAAAINGSNITNLPAPSTANVGSATAGLAVLDVGSYAFGNQVNPSSGAAAATSLGDNVSGSNIKASNAAGSNPGPTLSSGTWKAMGQGSGTSSHEFTTLVWLRVS